MLLKPERGGKYFRRVQNDHGKCARDSKLADHAECCSHRNYGRVTCSANIRACLGLNTKSYGFNVATNVNIETSIFQIPIDTVWDANLFYTPIAYCWKCTYSWWRKTVTRSNWSQPVAVTISLFEVLSCISLILSLSLAFNMSIMRSFNPKLKETRLISSCY